MRLSWFRIAVLVIATIVGHDVYMATTGHALIATQELAPVRDDDPHQRHLHHAPTSASAADHDRPAPGGMPGHCDPLRVAAPLNRDISPSFETIQVALLPDPANSMQFASTSRDIVETPLPHPPDLDRAFFQVYRI